VYSQDLSIRCFCLPFLFAFALDIRQHVQYDHCCFLFFDDSQKRFSTLLRFGYGLFLISYNCALCGEVRSFLYVFEIPYLSCLSRDLPKKRTMHSAFKTSIAFFAGPLLDGSLPLAERRVDQALCLLP